MSNFTVLHDACVLYPAPLRDLLMHIAVTDLYGIEAQHPDDFLTFQLDLAPNIICAAVKRHRASLKNPPKDVEEYLATLEAQGLTQTVSSLRKFAELI